MSGQIGRVFNLYPPVKAEVNIGCSIQEWKRDCELVDRRLYLYGEISTVDEDGCGELFDVSMPSKLVEQIFDFNRHDCNVDPKEREPIRLYINSPGGDLIEGFAVVSAIQLSKTPIYTINVGQWSSMAFLIGIAGHRRFSMPNATFLMHDGFSGAFGSTNKLHDQMKFQERFEKEVVKNHVLRYSKMTSEDYDARAREEFYMLPADALKYGFIDEIVDDIDTVL